jgi:hypothetical protein
VRGAGDGLLLVLVPGGGGGRLCHDEPLASLPGHLPPPRFRKRRTYQKGKKTPHKAFRKPPKLENPRKFGKKPEARKKAVNFRVR